MAALPESRGTVPAAASAVLRAGLRALQLGGDDRLECRLLDYAQLLHRWNRRYALSGARGLPELISRHLLDSLTLHSHLGSPRHWLDVGSGAGLPGLPLALATPRCHFTLLDRSLNKARFLRQAKLELGIDNISVAHTELRSFEPEPPPEGIMARAVMPLSALLRKLRHLCRGGTRLLIPHGRYPAATLRSLPAAFRLLACPRVALPEWRVERHLLILEGRG